MKYSDPQTAFKAAIASGRMTEQSASGYMYMGQDDRGRDLFKNTLTRAYLSHDTNLRSGK
jgi:hypothetical protein